MPNFLTRFRFFVVVIVTLLFLDATGQRDCRAAEPVSGIRIPGLDSSKLEPQLRGSVLLAEMNCVACHVSDSQQLTSSKKAPRLAEVATRINPHYLERFIRAPHQVKPGTPMPHAMSHLDEQKQREAAKSISHYLLSLKSAKPFELQVIDSVAAEFGRELFHTVGCVACHSPRGDDMTELLQGSSVPLGPLHSKYNVKSLAEFIRTPHRTRPSGRMPDMRLQQRDIERIAHYLLRETRVPGHLNYTTYRGRVWEGLDGDVEKEKAGHVNNFELRNITRVNHNSAFVFSGYLEIAKSGDYSFFFEMNGGELRIDDIEVLKLEQSNRRGIKKVDARTKLDKGWHKIEFTYYHTGREPSLKFEMAGPGFARAPIPASMLSISKTPIEKIEPYEIDASLAAKGKQYFSQLGCGNCHDDAKADKKSYPVLNDLDGTKGCLGDEDGSWPKFDLTKDQKQLLQSALGQVDNSKLTAEQEVNKTLVTFNCITCHDRAGLGGVAPERNVYFTGTHKELGNEGRIPPPLTHVGAKLNKQWISEVMLRGQRQRAYLNTKMPQFGEANVGHIVDAFEKIDSLEEVEFESIDDVDEYKAAGHKLMGTEGFSCIACHDFNGQKASGPGAMDIVHSTSRVKKDWFYLFMLKPARFHTGTIMPSAWPGGFVFKKNILDGDSKKQIESLWVYLKDGKRAKHPLGLSRQSPELRVTDETVICRGRGVGSYRTIGVGYPERISLAFDTEEMNLRSLWKGDFANVNHGSFSPRGHDRISLAPGIPFHRLETLEDNWPYKRKTDYLFPQDHGYQYRGYYLDKKKRPTFMYRYGDVKVEENFLDVLDPARPGQDGTGQEEMEKRAYFKRTIVFESPAPQKQFYFRAATAKSVVEKEGAFVADRLRIKLVTDHKGIIRDGDPAELLIPLTLPKGKSTLVLEYRW
jgi:mono/diheme cytochrome c family protein